MLVGALVCGPKHDGEAYAPDERETLATVAHAVGVALSVLSAGRSEVEAAILGLQEQFAGLRSELRLLVDLMRADQLASRHEPPP